MENALEYVAGMICESMEEVHAAVSGFKQEHKDETKQVFVKREPGVKEEPQKKKQKKDKRRPTKEEVEVLRTEI